MSIFPEGVEKAIEAMNKEIIKASEFETNPQLQFVKVEKVKGKYGAAEDSAIVERGILEEGEQFLYTFKDKEGDIRKHYSTSFPLLIAMQQAELNENDWIVVKRTGKAAETRYSVEKMEL